MSLSVHMTSRSRDGDALCSHRVRGLDCPAVSRLTGSVLCDAARGKGGNSRINPQANKAKHKSDRGHRPTPAALSTTTRVLFPQPTADSWGKTHRIHRPRAQQASTRKKKKLHQERTRLDPSNRVQTLGECARPRPGHRLRLAGNKGEAEGTGTQRFGRAQTTIHHPPSSILHSSSSSRNSPGHACRG
jgi:hypothetical protein